MGITGVEVEKYEAQLGVNLNVDKGVIILEIDPSSPAKKAGLENGDVLTKIDNQEVKNMSQLKKILYKYNKGDKASLNIIRNGKSMNVDIVFTVLK